MPGSPDLAIVLSGGGSKGAFQVGVLDELVTRRGLSVDLYAGISTGAIQALGAAQDRIDDLRGVWEGIESERDIFKKRFLGIVGALIGGADSLYNAEPVRELIREFHDPAALAAAGKGLLVGAVSLGSGRLRYFNESDPNITEWVIASSAVPATYQPLVTSDGDKWVDGGVRDMTPLGAVIERRPKAILAILASNSTKGPGRGSDSYDDLVEIALRATGILTDEVFMNDIAQVGRINGLLDAAARQREVLMELGLDDAAINRAIEPIMNEMTRFRDVPIMLIEPDADFDLPGSTSFKPDEIARTIAHGEAVAARPDVLAALKALKARAGIG
ncbi:MAG: patatin-like phospholipase family protein [Pacificimonas sp.]